MPAAGLREGTPAIYQARLAISALAFLLLAVPSMGREISSAVYLTRAQQIRDLPAGEAQKELPVHLRGVVTYFDLPWHTLFIQDATAGIFVNLAASHIDAPLHIGQLVDIQGVTGPGDFCPILTHTTIHAIGSSSLPAPRLASIDEFFTGRLDSQWVRMHGVLRSSQKLAGKVRFSLIDGGRRFTMLVTNNPASLPVDSEVTVMGVLGTRFNAQRQLIGIQLFVPSLNFVHVVRTGSLDPFRLPETSIGQLGQYRTGNAAGGRVRVRGVVTAIDFQSVLYISDGSEGLAVYSKDKTIHPGDRIEAVGFPDSLDSRRILQDALCRRIPGRGGIAPVALAASQIIPAVSTRLGASETKYDMALVRLDGEVVQISHLMRYESFVFRSGDTIFEGALPHSDPAALKSLKTGTRVRLTGLCLIKYDAFQQAESFRLLLRNPQDIQVLGEPSWFTAEHGFWLSAGLLLILSAILIWIRSLHGEVRRQKTQIQVTKAHEIAMEGRYRCLVEANLAGVVTMSQDGTILDCNPAFADLAGKDDREALIGASFSDLCTPNDASSDFLSLLLRRGAVSSCEIQLRRDDGRIIWAIASGCRAESKDGEPALLLATLVDVTAQQQYERELIAAKEAAEVASRMKSLFLANMSHEIRTPLNGVLGMTELALECHLSEDVRDYLDTVLASGINLLNLLNDILDFSNIEAGKMILESVEFSPREVIRTAVRTLESKAFEKNIELIYNVDESVPPAIIGDPHRLQQILLNLLGNALKFTSKGEVFMSATARRLEGTEERAELEIAIRDTGIGIPADMRQKIFESFTQLDGSNTRRYGGTGLGLAISSQLVGLMGGSISVESEPSKGSVFTLTAPFPLASKGAANVSGKRALISGLGVLIVDSNESSRTHLGRIMGAWGMRACLAANADEAAELLMSVQGTQQPIALILADYRVSRLSELAHESYMWRSSQQPRFLLMGSAYIEGRSSLCHELDAVEFVVKPIDPVDLYSAVISALGLFSPHSGSKLTSTDADLPAIEAPALSLG